MVEPLESVGVREADDDELSVSAAVPDADAVSSIAVPDGERLAALVDEEEKDGAPFVLDSRGETLDEESALAVEETIADALGLRLSASASEGLVEELVDALPESDRERTGEREALDECVP